MLLCHSKLILPFNNTEAKINSFLWAATVVLIEHDNQTDITHPFPAAVNTNIRVNARTAFASSTILNKIMVLIPMQIVYKFKINCPLLIMNYIYNYIMYLKPALNRLTMNMCTRRYMHGWPLKLLIFHLTRLLPLKYVGLATRIVVSSMSSYFTGKNCIPYNLEVSITEKHTCYTTTWI